MDLPIQKQCFFVVSDGKFFTTVGLQQHGVFK